LVAAIEEDSHMNVVWIYNNFKHTNKINTRLYFTGRLGKPVVIHVNGIDNQTLFQLVTLEDVMHILATQKQI
jgi:hypothetical protein